MSDARRESVMLSMTPAAVVRRSLAMLAGTAFIAAAAQVSVQLPVTPVPWTLQPLAVLIVGGILGPRLGTTTLAMYLALGAAGLPVFAPGGVLGIGRLVGPTGGYLLAYPFAAFLVGALVADGSRFLRVGLAVGLGLVIIHAGGVAMLALIYGNWSEATRLGTLPFLVGDLVKVLIAAVVIRRLTGTIRARL